MLRGTKIQPGRVFYTPEPDQFQTLFESMLSEGAKGLPQTHEICLAYFRILILKTEGASSTTSPSINQMASSFQACKKAIDSNFTTLKDLADIARQVHLSPAYVCRLFRKFGHQSPFQYLILKKLNHAASLLLADATSVKAVAYAVGYSDPYHFSKSFSRFFGISPAKFTATHSRKPHS
jgi:AraC-like DNA-binding protein